ncbi:MAG: hypothetical protein LBT59_12075 [Clostridiales bacterium]|nr:hypothetical protein [Clostridiales bacterium]
MQTTSKSMGLAEGKEIAPTSKGNVQVVGSVFELLTTGCVVGATIANLAGNGGVAVVFAGIAGAALTIATFCMVIPKL